MLQPHRPRSCATAGGCSRRARSAACYGRDGTAPRRSERAGRARRPRSSRCARNGATCHVKAVDLDPAAPARSTHAPPARGAAVCPAAASRSAIRAASAPSSATSPCRLGRTPPQREPDRGLGRARERRRARHHGRDAAPAGAAGRHARARRPEAVPGRRGSALRRDSTPRALRAAADRGGARRGETPERPVEVAARSCRRCCGPGNPREPRRLRGGGRDASSIASPTSRDRIAARRRCWTTSMRDFGRLDGVVHGAGIIEDKLLVDKDPASWSRVRRHEGAQRIPRSRSAVQARDAQLLRPLRLRRGALRQFSGQTDYATANELLNRLAWQLARRRGRGASGSPC